MKFEHVLLTHCSECRHAVKIDGYNVISCAANNGTIHHSDGFCDFGLPHSDKFKEFDERVRKGANE